MVLGLPPRSGCAGGGVWLRIGTGRGRDYPGACRRARAQRLGQLRDRVRGTARAVACGGPASPAVPSRPRTTSRDDRARRDRRWKGLTWLASTARWPISRTGCSRRPSPCTRSPWSASPPSSRSPASDGRRPPAAAPARELVGAGGPPVTTSPPAHAARRRGARSRERIGRWSLVAHRRRPGRPRRLDHGARGRRRRRAVVEHVRVRVGRRARRRRRVRRRDVEGPAAALPRRLRPAAGHPDDVPGRDGALLQGAAARPGAAVLLAGHPRHPGVGRRGRADDQRRPHRAVPDQAAARQALAASPATSRSRWARSPPSCRRPRRWTRPPTASSPSPSRSTPSRSSAARSGPRRPGDATGAGTRRRPGRSSSGSSTPATCTPARPPAGRAAPRPGSTSPASAPSPSTSCSSTSWCPACTPTPGCPDLRSASRLKLSSCRRAMTRSPSTTAGATARPPASTTLSSSRVSAPVGHEDVGHHRAQDAAGQLDAGLDRQQTPLVAAQRPREGVARHRVGAGHQPLR